MSKEEYAKAADSSFSSDKHAQLILAQMNKMRTGQHFCDVQLQVGKETFRFTVWSWPPVVHTLQLCSLEE